MQQWNGDLFRGLSNTESCLECNDALPFLQAAAKPKQSAANYVRPKQKKVHQKTHQSSPHIASTERLIPSLEFEQGIAIVAAFMRAFVLQWQNNPCHWTKDTKAVSAILVILLTPCIQFMPHTGVLSGLQWMSLAESTLDRLQAIALRLFAISLL